MTKDSESPSLRDGLSNLLSNIDALVELKQNWNSYGALPVNHDSIKWAKDFANQLAVRHPEIETPSLGATPSGFVVLSWRDAQFELEVELDENGIISYCDSSGLEDRLSFDETIPLIVEKIEKNSL